ncbi:MAG: hypothetical protein GF405_03295 [Candidatus Eisenbacteria bacterium]|nr:hypothetical protein [Candidatus Eisenbacteria bacterium]
MGSDKKAEPRTRAGCALACPVCGHERFWVREAQLNTRLMSFLDLDFVNPRGQCYICGNCRHIMWFYGEDERP